MNLAADIGQAARALRKSPGFALAALSILTLGIGANTAIFSVVNAVLLKPLPFPHSDRVVAVFHVPPPKAFPGLTIFSVSAGNYLDWRAQNSVFETISIVGFRGFRLGGGSRPEAVLAAASEPDFFTVLRTPPAVGRAYQWDECRQGKDAVVVVSDAFARSHFGSAQGAVGRTIELDGMGRRVIGVMPANFQVRSWFPAAVDAWVPLAWTPQQRSVRGNHNYAVVARLRDGVSLARAKTEMDVISDRLARAYPEENTGWGATVIPLRDHLVGDVRPALLTLLGAVGFVLLIACANTANLVLARTISRRKELAIRTALGASTVQVLRPVLLETTLLAITGGALGLILAHYGQSLVLRALAEQMPRATEAKVDGAVLAFTLLASVLTGLGAGFIGSWRLLRVDLNESLKQGGKSSSEPARRRTRNWLVSSEVALSLMLLFGAGLMIRSFQALNRVDAGFLSANVMTMSAPTIDGNASAGSAKRFYNEFLPRVRSLPGVISVAAIDTLPLDDGGSQQPVVVEGKPAEVFALQPNVAVRRATPGYIGAMRIPLLRGRDFAERDITSERAVVLISQSMAKQFWPGEDPVGKRLRISFTPEIVREVVGVVGDVKERGLNVLEPVSMMYVPLDPAGTDFVSLLVRTEGDPSRTVPAISSILRSIDPELPIRDVRAMDEIVAASLTQYRFGMFLFSALGALALLLAAVGIFSVLAYSVRRRVQEIGVRIALGARRHHVLELVIVEGMKPTLAGIVAGIAGAWAASGILSRLTYGISATDPYTFSGVSAILASVALAACIFPALRAVRVDPARALRNE